MAYIAGNRNTPLTLGARLSEIFSGLGEAYTQWRVYRRTLAELQDLSDRELDDLGLNRATLRSAAYVAAYGADD
ncbi:MAG: DUF1127 domain-containing protein [Pseudomonadota bacterium]